DTFEAEETAAPELETPDVSHLEDGTSFDIEPLEEEEEAPFDIEPVLEDEPAAEAGVLNDDEPLDEFETFAEEDIFEDEDRPLDLETPAELERDDEPQEAVEPIEIYTEPELEEAIQNLARSSSAGDVYETYEELKTGFEKQLSAEDAGTHFNLGKEYLEMELFKEASREFKIALKDKNLGLDCYINLAACAISEASYEEAIIYYLKVLKAFNGSDAKRKGFLYDLATAYDASGQEREAEAIFNSIYEGDPRFRDVAKKIKKSRTKKMSIPLNDSIIEVELL
ncbi:MAG: hypothetical protein ACE5EZ_06365, partial [Thermodesulfobacteriota bacterium]